MIKPDSIAILKNPPHPEMARHFLEFVLSRAGQLFWMLPKGAPGGATRDMINRMSVCPRSTTSSPASRPSDQPVQAALRLRLLQRARLETAHHPQRRSSPRG